MKPNIRIAAVLAAAYSLTLCGCSPVQNSAPAASVSESSQTQAAADDDFLMSAEITHPESTDKQTVWLLFVKKDGSVLAAEYSNDESYDFFRKKAQRDPEIWNHLQEIQTLGKLTDEECSSLAEAIAAADPNAEKKTRSEREPTPDVQETYQIVYDLYLPDQPTLYAAYARGEQKGESIRSKDPNAMKAVSIIEESGIFQQWLQEHK